MSKATVLAAALIGAGLGCKWSLYNYGEDTSAQEDTNYFSKAVEYAPIAVAMVEAAHEVTFQYPDNYGWKIYWEFGNDYGAACDTESDDDDVVYTFCDHKVALNMLKSLLLSSFEEVASEGQTERIEKALNAIIEQAA